MSPDRSPEQRAQPEQPLGNEMPEVVIQTPEMKRQATEALERYIAGLRRAQEAPRLSPDLIGMFRQSRSDALSLAKKKEDPGKDIQTFNRSADAFLSRLPKTERPAGFAKLPQQTDLSKGLEAMNTREKMDLLRSIMERKELSPDIRRRVQQLDIARTLLEDQLVQTEEPKTRWGRFMNVRRKMHIPALTRAMGLAEREEDARVTLHDAHRFTLETQLPEMRQNLFTGANSFMGEVDRHPYLKSILQEAGLSVVDAQTDEEILGQYTKLVSYLNKTKSYERAARLVEELLPEEFREAEKNISSSRHYELVHDALDHAKRIRVKNEEAWRHPSQKMLDEGAKPMTDGQIAELEQGFYEEKKNILIHEEAAKYIDGKTFAGAKAELWSHYTDGAAKKETWDKIFDEVAINAPLIMASGGIASAARAGLSKAGCLIAGKILVRQAVKAGIEAGSGSALEIGTSAVARWAGTNALKRGTLAAAGLVTEGAAFELAHAGLTGDIERSLPEWGTSILWSAATLGAFHGSGKLSERLFSKTVMEGGKAVTRDVLLGNYLSGISNGAVREVAKQLLAKGHIEAATMMLVGAIQNGAYDGNLDEFFKNFGDELLHSYISVGALKVGHAGVRALKIGHGTVKTDVGTSQPVKIPADTETAGKERGTPELEPKVKPPEVIRLQQEGYTVKQLPDGSWHARNGEGNEFDFTPKPPISPTAPFKTLDLSGLPTTMERWKRGVKSTFHSVSEQARKFLGKPSTIPSTGRRDEEYREFLFPEQESVEGVMQRLRGKYIVDIGSGVTHALEPSLGTRLTMEYPETTYVCVDPRLGFPVGHPKGFSPDLTLWGKAPDALKKPIDGSRVKLVAASGEHLPFADRSVDVYLSCYLMPWHIKSPGALLKFFSEMHRVLKAGGEARLGPLTQEHFELLTKNPALRQYLREHFDVQIFEKKYTKQDQIQVPDFDYSLRLLRKADNRIFERNVGLETKPKQEQREMTLELKEGLKADPVDDATRIALAEKLLGRPLPKEVADTILASHSKPGAIDEGNMTKNIFKEGPIYDALRAEHEKTMPVEQAHERAMRETKLILDAGLCGAPPPPPPPLRKERPPAHAEKTETKTPEGLAVYRVRHQGKEYMLPEGHIVIVEKGTSRKGVEIPTNRPYEIRFNRGEQGQLEPILHPLDPADQRAGDYSLDLSQTTWRTLSASTIKDWKAVGWKSRTPEPPPPRKRNQATDAKENRPSVAPNRQTLDRGTVYIKQKIDAMNATFRTFREHVKNMGNPDTPEDLIYSDSLDEAMTYVRSCAAKNKWKASELTAAEEQLKQLHGMRSVMEAEWNPPSGNMQKEIGALRAKVSAASLPQQTGKRLQPDPEAVHFPSVGEPATKVWLCKRIGDFKPQVVKIFRTKNGSLILAGTDETRGMEQAPLTDKFRKALAPVRDLRAEAVRQERPESGWKLHLNFDGENFAVRARIAAILRKLEQESLVAGWKIGHRGGKRAGAPGKEATVYIGHGKKAKLVADYLNRELADVLRPPEGDTLDDDIRLSGNVVGRFDLNGDPEFHQYGGNGIPYRMQDMRSRTPSAEAAKKADAVLRERYGDFYEAVFKPDK